MVKGKHYKLMTETEWKGLKSMMDAKVTLKTINKVTGRSINTLDFISKSTSFIDYKKLVREHLAKYNKPAPIPEIKQEPKQEQLEMKSDTAKTNENGNGNGHSQTDTQITKPDTLMNLFQEILAEEKKQSSYLFKLLLIEERKLTDRQTYQRKGLFNR